MWSVVPEMSRNVARSIDSGDDYIRYKFRCDVYDDYQTYAKWEKSILESLEIEAIRQKAQSERTEENKQI